ncbi:MAG: polysaccharide biosynthesis/export family protein [Armatimonadota bacterium]
MPVLGNAADSDYKLGPEDVITVMVMNHTEFSGDFYIPTDGKITIPLAGTVEVTGKTLTEAAALIADNLKSELKDPDVTIVLKTPRPQLVYVMGAVKQPGPYNLKPGWRITEAVTAAGGIPSGIEAADCKVSILRGTSGDKQMVSLQEAMRGNESANQAVRAGDVITVENVELIPVYVMGKVARPGVYNIRKDSAGILEAITMAGGTLDDAALTKVTVTHLNGSSETINIVPATIEGKQETPVKLQSGDLLVVPDSIARFAVMGWVNAPGFFPLKENQQVTLSDALALARGADNKRGGLKKVAILRTTSGKQERLVVDFQKFAKKGDMSQNPVIQPGDIVWVPETGKLDWDRVFANLSTGLSFLWSIDRWND